MGKNFHLKFIKLNQVLLVLIEKKIGILPYYDNNMNSNV